MCGKSRGEVSLHSTRDGSELRILYRHTLGSSIVSVVIAESSRLVITADRSSQIKAVKTNLAEQSQGDTEVVVDKYFGLSVRKLMVNR